MLFSMLLLNLSATCFNFMKDYLILPHKRYVQSISASLNVSLNDIDSNVNYFEKIYKTLSEREKYVYLLLDEIHVNSCLNFKGNNVVGTALNNSSELAKSVLSFMISSCFGHLKEIVKLFPVITVTGEDLKVATLQVIKFVQNIGFIVVAIISDNSRVNQNINNFLMGIPCRILFMKTDQFSLHIILFIYLIIYKRIEQLTKVGRCKDVKLLKDVKVVEAFCLQLRKQAVLVKAPTTLTSFNNFTSLRLPTWGHELHRHLQEQGYSDYEVVSTKSTSGRKGVQQVLQEIVKAVRSGLGMIIPGCEASNEKVYASLQSNVNIILKSGLLLEADYQIISCFLESINLANEQPLWKNVSLLYGIGTCIITRAWRKDLLPWLIPGVFTYVAASHFVSTWYVHQQKRKFSMTVFALLHVLKEVSYQTRKVILYIQENELLLRGFTLARSRTALMDDLKSLRLNWYLMIGLRERTAQVMLDIIGILKSATKDVVREFPLKGKLDHEYNYAAFLIPEEEGITHDTDDVKKYNLEYLKILQNANILLQSEFLRRFALCCIPSLWSDEFQSLTPLLETSDSVSQILCKFVESLIFDYKFYSCYGKEECNRNRQPLPLKYNVSNAFVGVHSARLHVQGMLHKTVQLEEMLEKNEQKDMEPNVLNHILTELEDITNEMTSCTNCIEIAITCCKSLKDNFEAPVEVTSLSLPLDCASVQQSDPIPVGYSDFDPEVEDEVFEAFINHIVDNDDDHAHDPYYFKIEEKERQQKECSWRMMSELKTVLVHKAEEMKKREDQVLRNKGQLITEDSSGCEADASQIDTPDVSEADTLKSEMVDSLKSEMLDFLKSEIDTSSAIESNNIKFQPSEKDWPRTRLSLKPLAKTLVGEEETFGDSSESDTDELDYNNIL